MNHARIPRPIWILPGLAALVGLGWAAAAPGLKGQPPRRPEARLTDADRLYQQHCARCHGEDFTGAVWRDPGRRIPDFTRAAWQDSRSDAQLLVSIREGKGVRMPAFAGQLDDEQARDLVQLLRRADAARPAAAFSGPAHDAAFTRRYAALCAELNGLRQEYRELANEAAKEDKERR
jgi:mono/diheme cytochrome c family protein